MAHYRIFLPNSKATAADDLRRVGLGELLRDDDWDPSTAQSAGPHGMRGAMVSWDSHPCRPGVESPRYEFNAAGDVAIEAPGDAVNKLPQGRFWLITERDRPVTPGDLCRKPADSFDDLMPSAKDPEHIRLAKAERLKTLTRYAGRAVTLGDRNEWTFPNMLDLPASYRLDERGVWGEQVRPKFRATFDRMMAALNACRSHVLHDLIRDLDAEQLHEHLDDEDRRFLTSEAHSPLDQQAAIVFLCDMLALNYRVNPWLISELGLFDPSNHWPSLMACTDAAALRDLYLTCQKKILQLRQRASSICSGVMADSSGNQPSAIGSN